MKIIILLSFIFIFSTIIFAQTNSEQWTDFAGIGEEFSVSVPQKMSIRIIDEKKPDSQRYYKSVSNHTIFFIASSKNESESHLTQILKITNENNAIGTEFSDFRLTGKQFSFSDSEGFHHRIITVQAKERFYIFHTIGLSSENSDIEKFFNSISLNNTFIVNRFLSKSEEKVLDTQKLPENSKNSDNPTNGQGNGNGGVMEQSSTKTQQNSNTPENFSTSTVKIRISPRPSYTDLARIYDIQGSVLLKVTFLANGTIGGVSVINKLPLGLTNNAISAANQIQFNPAKRNGTPYSVTKTIDYSFNIY